MAPGSGLFDWEFNWDEDVPAPNIPCRCGATPSLKISWTGIRPGWDELTTKKRRWATSIGEEEEETHRAWPRGRASPIAPHMRAAHAAAVRASSDLAAGWTTCDLTSAQASSGNDTERTSCSPPTRGVSSGAGPTFAAREGSGHRVVEAWGGCKVLDG
jgi:hypothetical protein